MFNDPGRRVRAGRSFGAPRSAVSRVPIENFWNEAAKGEGAAFCRSFALHTIKEVLRKRLYVNSGPTGVGRSDLLRAPDQGVGREARVKHLAGALGPGGRKFLRVDQPELH